MAEKKNIPVIEMIDEMHEALVASLPLHEAAAANGLDFECKASSDTDIPTISFNLMRKVGGAYTCLFTEAIHFDEADAAERKKRVSDIIGNVEKVIKANGLDIKLAALKKKKDEIEAEIRVISNSITDDAK